MLGENFCDYTPTTILTTYRAYAKMARPTGASHARSAAAMAKLLGSIMYFRQGSAIPVLSPVRRTGVVTLGQGPKSSRGGTAKRTLRGVAADYDGLTGSL